MAVRATSWDLSDLDTFLREYEEHLDNDTVVVPADSIDGDELALQFNLDLVLPFRGRVGPVRCNVLRVLDNGDTAAQVPDWPDNVAEAVESVFQTIERVRQHLLDLGEVVLPGEVREVIVERVVPAPAVAAPTEEAVDDQYVARRRTYGYEIPDVLDQAPMAQGSLAGRGLRSFLVDIAVNQTTGLLTVIQEDGVQRYGFWVDGGPVGWRREPLDEEETLGGLLKKAEKVSDEHVQQALDIMDSEGCKQGEALVRMGLLTPGQIPAVLKRQCEFIFQMVLRTHDGVWAFFPVDQFPQRFAIPPVNVPEVLFRAMMNHARNVTSEKLYTMLRPRLENHISVRASARQILAGFAWDDQERKLLELVSQPQPLRVRKLFSITPMTKAGTAGTIWALNEMGFIDFGEGEDLERKVRRIRGPILKKREKVQGANAFDVLEVHWIITTKGVEAAHKKLKNRYDPLVFGEVPSELTEALTTINARLATALEELGDAEARRSARSAIVGEELIAKAAVALAKKGEAAMRVKDKPLAIDCYAKAADLVPDEMKYRTGLDRARSMLAVRAQAKKRRPIV
ncbi:MAG TPA: hypothetical protein QGF58_05065 [Myxococcota bacterium]|nr:hypothetical protein [Myxococcota bacterium]